MTWRMPRSFHRITGAGLLIVTALLLSVPARGQGSIPTPESVLGFRPGADFHLASFDQALNYFRQLDAASDRLELREVCRTTTGLPMVIALISSAENLRNLEHYREISLRLAHPEGLTDEEARRLAEEGRAIVHIDGGMHSSECAGHQHAIQLAWDLVAGSDDTEIAAILDNVIFILWPTLNPDGMNWLAEWYASNLGTPFEVAGMPRLYQEYVGHDNNRDGYMINMIESRAITRVLREFEPQILYNHHQTAPFPTRIWIPPFAEPVSPHVHPLMWRTVNLIGMAMSQALEERGQPGATHMGTGFDDWYPGFMDHANSFHNVASLLTETGLYRYATPHFYTVRDFPADKQDLRPESLYPSPWPGGWWRLGDAVAYMHTASMSVLDVAAKYRFDLLYNRYQAGRDIIARYREEPPFAYFIDRHQRDPVAPVELLRRLAFNGIEVHQLARDVTFQGIRHRAGTWVIAMDQPFANFVRQLFEVQEYPDIRPFPGGPMDQPYDVAGWTLPLQMGVEVVTATEPLTEEVRAALEAVAGTAVEPGGEGAAFDTPPDAGFDTHPVAAAIVPVMDRFTGSGDYLALDPAQNNAFRAINEVWRDTGGGVFFEPGTPGEVGEAGTAGRYLVAQRDLHGLELTLHLRAERRRSAAGEIPRPRIGLYAPWGGSSDEGWTRWLLEMYGFAFDRVRPGEIRTGDLKERFDVLILADQRSGTIIEGQATGTMPARYTGGIEAAGVRAIDRFVREGGTLVCVNASCAFAIDELALPVRDVTRGVSRDSLFIASSILQVRTDPSHPVMAGMPEQAPVFVGRSPVFEAEEGFRGRALALYATNGSPLLSGYLLGEEHLQGRAAALDVQHGGGHVILIGFRPHWRGQPFGSFRVLFNAALYTGPVAAATPAESHFWTPERRENR